MSTQLVKPCPRCSRLSAPNVPLCPHCGSLFAPNSGAQQPQPLLCLACNSPYIQRVSAICAAGMWTANSETILMGGDSQGHMFMAGGPTQTSGASLLAQMLAPPPQPRMPHAVALVAAWCVGIPTVCLWAACFYGYLLRLAGEASYEQWILCTTGMAIALILSLFTIALIVAGSHENGANRQRFNAHWFRWQAAMRSWNTLYYCPRCDTVSNPVHRKYGPPSAAAALIWM